MSKPLRRIFPLALKNIKSHKWLYARMAIAFGVLVFLVCLLSTYAFALNHTQTSMKNEKMSANYLISNEPINELPYVMESFSVQNYNFVPDIEKWFGEEVSFLTANRLCLFVDGKEYHPLEEYRWEALDVYAGEKLLTQNDITELSAVYGVSSCMIGQMPKSAKDILVSEEFLGMYGLANDVVGKKITIVADNDEKTLILDSVICGVITSVFNKLNGRLYVGSQIVPSLFLPKNNELFQNRENVQTKYIYSFSSWLSKAQIEELTQNYDCSFAGNSILEKITFIKQLQSITTRLFLIVGLALGISLVLMIFLMMDKLIRIFSRSSGIFLTCGMKWSEVKGVLLVLLLSVCLFAVPISAGLSVASFYVINLIIYSAYSIEISISFGLVALLFLIGLAVVLLIALLYYFYGISVMRKRTIKEFLNVQLD